MILQKVLEEAKDLAIPSKKEQEAVNQVSKLIKSKVNQQLKKSKINAELIIGGSVAKGTYLPGATDIDCFLRFNYKTYSKKSKDLSDIAEKILKKCFRKISRLHGSRDYFQIKVKKFIIEIIPVLKISKASRMVNITDVSPLHVNWMTNRIEKSKIDLTTEIRLAKQFFKGQGVYGAESYIRGFSGHVIEVLTSHYGSFEDLLEAMTHWEHGHLIDTALYYKGKKEALSEINKSKLYSPLIVVDPIQPERNAASALEKDKFDKIIESAKKFVNDPSIEYFKLKKISPNDLPRKKNTILITLSAKPEKGKKDIIGAKLLKQFEYIFKHAKLEDFKIIDNGWQWVGTGDALFWFYFDKKTLPELRRHQGPPKKDKVRSVSFRKKYKSAVKEDNENLYVMLKRKFRHPIEFLLSTIKNDQFKNIKIIK